MATDVFEFRWRVSEGGYQWLNRRAAGDKVVQPWLTDAVPLGTMYDYEEYYPLQKATGLFRTFAETAATQEGIQSFAHEYGLLGESSKLIEVPPRKPGGGNVGHGEAFSTWEHHIATMRRAVNLWDMAQAGKV